jgi:hypothetical protein
MKHERFYYSEDLTISNLEVLTASDGNIVASGNLQPKRKFPRLTICGLYDKDNSELSFGVARCSGNDSFVKSTGRNLARERALKSPYKKVHVNTAKKVHDVFIDECLVIEEEVWNMDFPIKLCSN